MTTTRNIIYLKKIAFPPEPRHCTLSSSMGVIRGFLIVKIKLAKVLKGKEVVALAFGAMIGWSWVLLSGYWVNTAGALGTVYAFVIGGTAITLIGLLYSELAAALPKVGGEHVYTYRALGPRSSFVCTWALLMAYSTVCIFEAVALPTGVEYLLPAIKFGYLWTFLDYPVYFGFVLVGAIGTIAMTWINIRGIRTAAIVQSIITLVIVASGVLLFTGAALHGSAQNAQPALANGVSGVLVILIMVPALLVGFDVIPQSAEEIDLAPNRIGWLLVISVIIAVLWYAFIGISVAFGLPPDLYDKDSMATADAASLLWSSDNAGTFLVVGGIGGILTSWNAFVIGGSRVMLALAESGMLPPFFARLHPKYKTPYVSVLTLGVLSLFAPLFGRTLLVWLVDAGSFAIIISYFFVALAFIALRNNEPELDRPFTVPAGKFVGYLAALMCVGLFALFMPWSPSALLWPYEWMIVLIWGGLGTLVFFGYANKRLAATK